MAWRNLPDGICLPVWSDYLDRHKRRKRVGAPTAANRRIGAFACVLSPAVRRLAVTLAAAVLVSLLAATVTLAGAAPYQQGDFKGFRTSCRRARTASTTPPSSPPSRR